MRAALYCSSIGVLGCPERIVHELVARSRHEWLVFTQRYVPESTFSGLRQAPIVEVGRLRRLPLAGARVLVVLSADTADLVNLRGYPVPVVCLCFTPLRAAFDPGFQARYLERLAWGRLRRRAFLACAAGWRALDRILWKRYSTVFAISGEVRRRIGRAGLRDPRAVQVLHPGVDTVRLSPSPAYTREFVVPGRIAWYSNIETAIAAFRLLLERRPNLGDFRMTVAGCVDRASRDYAATLRAAAVACPRIRIIETPSHESLLSLCRTAYAVVLPGFGEESGLLALEAMALGRPVVALDPAGCNEIVTHGQTGLLVDGPEPLAPALEFLADNPVAVRSMGAQAREHALRFDWRYFFSRLDDAVSELAGEPSLRAAAAAAS